MPDITLKVNELPNQKEAGRLENALKRLEFVNEANADPQKGFVAVSYEGGEAEQERLEKAVKDAGYEFEAPPGARKLES